MPVSQWLNCSLQLTHNGTPPSSDQSLFKAVGQGGHRNRSCDFERRWWEKNKGKGKDKTATLGCGWNRKGRGQKRKTFHSSLLRVGATLAVSRQSSDILKPRLRTLPLCLCSSTAMARPVLSRTLRIATLQAKRCHSTAIIHSNLQHLNIKVWAALKLLTFLT